MTRAAGQSTLLPRMTAGAEERPDAPLLHRMRRHRRPGRPPAPARAAVGDRQQPRRRRAAEQGARAHSRQRPGRGVPHRRAIRRGFGEKADDMQRQQHSAHTARAARRRSSPTPPPTSRTTNSTGSASTWCRSACTSATRSYLDKLGLSPEEFYAELERNPEHPKTSQPPPGDFRRQFEFLASHYDVGRLDQSQRQVSGTCAAAESAAARIDDARQGHRDRQPQRVAGPGARRDVCGRMRSGGLRRASGSSPPRARSCRRRATSGSSGRSSTRCAADACRAGSRTWPTRCAHADPSRRPRRAASRPAASCSAARTCKESSRASCGAACAPTGSTACWSGHANCEADGQRLLDATGTATTSRTRGCFRPAARSARTAGRVCSSSSLPGIRGTAAVKIETLASTPAASRTRPPARVREPIQLSTTFERGADGSYPRGYYYSRAGNPNRTALERAVAALEGGADAVAFASGSAATLAVFALPRRGGRIVCGADCYHGTAKQLREVVPRWGADVAFVDTTDLAAVRARARRRAPHCSGSRHRRTRCSRSATSRRWPSCPRARRAARLRQHVREPGPAAAARLRRRPRDAQHDQVPRRAQRRARRHRRGARAGHGAGCRCAITRRTAGGVPSPFDCWLVLRSLPTLPLSRARAGSASRLAVAAFLHADRRVESVHYPGLVGHPGHAIAVRQMRGGFGGVRFVPGARAMPQRRSPSRRASSCSRARRASAAWKA